MYVDITGLVQQVSTVFTQRDRTGGIRGICRTAFLWNPVIGYAIKLAVIGFFLRFCSVVPQNIKDCLGDLKASIALAMQSLYHNNKCKEAGDV
jgi:hypothetical protein